MQNYYTVILLCSYSFYIQPPSKSREVWLKFCGYLDKKLIQNQTYDEKVQLNDRFLIWIICSMLLSNNTRGGPKLFFSQY